MAQAKRSQPPSEEEARKMYSELQHYDNQIKELQQEFGRVEGQIQELNELLKSLDEFGKQSTGSESFIPISKGIFIKATITDTDSFLVNVGSNVVVPKNREQTKDLITQQQKELQEYRQQIINKVTELDTRAAEIEQTILQS